MRGSFGVYGRAHLKDESGLEIAAWVCRMRGGMEVMKSGDVRSIVLAGLGKNAR